MKVILIGGYPGSGKSTIVKRVIMELDSQGVHFNHKKFGKLVKYMESKKLLIVGEYTFAKDELFPGTDKLSMGVQPEAEKFFIEVYKKNPDQLILLEGDRLFNKSMIMFLKYFKGIEVDLRICLVQLSRKNLEQRRNSRSEQDGKWRKGRETKVDRIATEFPIHHYLKNDTEKEQAASVEELLLEIEGKWKGEPPKSKLSAYWS